MDHGIADILTSAQIDPEARLWAAFATAGTSESVCRTWLALQCRALGRVDAAMLLTARPGAPFAPVAFWPDAAQDLGYLKPVAEQALQQGEPVVLRPPHATGMGGVHIAYPFLAEGDQPAGAVVLDLPMRSEAELQRTLRQLHWGVGWLEAQAVRDRMARERQRVTQAAAALDLVAVANEHERADGAAVAVANELARRLGASRVAIGLDAGRGSRLVALSHTAWFKRNTSLVRGIEAAMDEATDQRATVRLPAGRDDAVHIQVAPRGAARAARGGRQRDDVPAVARARRGWRHHRAARRRARRCRHTVGRGGGIAARPDPGQQATGAAAGVRAGWSMACAPASAR